MKNICLLQTEKKLGRGANCRLDGKKKKNFCPLSESLMRFTKRMFNNQQTVRQTGSLTDRQTVSGVPKTFFCPTKTFYLSKNKYDKRTILRPVLQNVRMCGRTNGRTNGRIDK